jgi:hypothetical protein
MKHKKLDFVLKNSKKLQYIDLIHMQHLRHLVQRNDHLNFRQESTINSLYAKLGGNDENN